MPLRFRGWPLWAWVLLFAAATCTLVLEFWVLVYLSLFGQPLDALAPETLDAYEDAMRALASRC